MNLKSRFLPWQPNVVFSGYSYYTIDMVYGKITRQRDVWDAVQDNSTPSVRHLVQTTVAVLCSVLYALLCSHPCNANCSYLWISACMVGYGG